MKHYLDRVEAAIKNNWNKKALSNYGKEDFTYGQAAEYIERLHIALSLLGAKRDDKIALCAANSAQWAMTFFSITTYDAVAVPLLNDFLPESVQTLTAHSDSTVIFTESDIWDRMDVKAIPTLIAAIDVFDGRLLWCRDEKWDNASLHAAIDKEFKQRFPGGLKPAQVSYPTGSQDELEVINYTSGTTSAPKGVMVTARGISYNVAFAIGVLPADSNDRLLSMLPMAHLYGMVFEFLYPFSVGVHITFLGKTPTPSTLIKAFASVKPYMVITVPLVIEKIFKSKVIPVMEKPVMKVLLKLPVINNVIYKKIRKSLIEVFGGELRYGIVVGGAAINEKVELVMRRMKFPYSVGYGMTECSPLIGYEDFKTFATRSCGKEVTGAKVRIDSPDPQHVVGEIQVKGENVMMGYYKNPEATREVFTDDGWFRTGDLGVVDKDGNIFIKGRSKNMILGGNGQNIYPEELEDKLNALPLVSESIVVSRGQRIVALVVPDMEAFKKLAAEGRTLESVMIDYQAQVNAQLPAYCQINKIELRNEPFEKTPKKSIKRFLYS
jgi:long-chain acyl-CoA synthetase